MCFRNAGGRAARCLLFCLSLVAGDHALRADESAAEEAKAKPKRLALLVGCDKYPSLKELRQLAGPGNDVLLLKRTLTQPRFGFEPAAITILSDREGMADSSRLPTRSNIQREFENLARNASAGGQVVILLAGHGSQQPDQPDPKRDDPEPDGKDELFLPRDIGQWEDKTARVANAIIDDELHDWIQPILDTGTNLWIILDCCHSGSGIRGTDDHVVREVPANELGIPQPAQEQARGPGSQAATMPRETASFDLASSAAAKGNLVVMYAAQSSEAEIETLMPIDRPGNDRYGMLTYTLCEILNSNGPTPTYRDLLRRTWSRYLGCSHPWPTPFLDGNNIDEVVLSGRPGSRAFTLTKTSKGTLTLDAGSLHGLTPRSILAVYPRDVPRSDAKPVGHIEVLSADLDSAVVQPVAFDKTPLREDLPDQSACEVAFLDFGDANDLKIPIAVDHAQTTGDPNVSRRLTTLEADLKLRASSPRAPYVVANGLASARWVVQARERQLELLPRVAAEIIKDADLPESTARFPVKGVDPAAAVEGQLAAIFRAENLLRLASSAAAGVVGNSDSVEVVVEMLRCKDRNDNVGQAIELKANRPHVRPNDWVAWRVTNRGLQAADITLLYIDSHWGIDSLFPRPAAIGVDNRLNHGQKYQTRPIRVTDDTLGLEHLVVIAVAARGPQIDFRSLAQPSLASSKSITSALRGSEERRTPLDRLLEYSTYLDGDRAAGTRGLARDEVTNSQVASISWEVQPIRDNEPSAAEGGK